MPKVVRSREMTMKKKKKNRKKKHTQKKEKKREKCLHRLTRRAAIPMMPFAFAFNMLRIN